MKKVMYLLLVVSFSVMSQAVIYVDATHGEGGNTMFAPSAGGGVWTVTNVGVTNDGIWRLRPGFGLSPTDTALPTDPVPTGGTGTIYESGGNEGADDVPRVVTTVSGLADAIYDVYVYFWSDQAGSPWQIRAGLEDTVDPLQLYHRYDGYSVQVGADTSNRPIWQAYLGQVTGTSISVFVDDGPATGGNERTWYDGIGYAVVPEPATMVLLGLGALTVIRKRK